MTIRQLEDYCKITERLSSYKRSFVTMIFQLSYCHLINVLLTPLMALMALECFRVGAKMWHKCNKCHIYVSFYVRMFPRGETFLVTQMWHKTDRADSYVSFMSLFEKGFCQFLDTFVFPVSFVSHFWTFVSVLCPISVFENLIIS